MNKKKRICIVFIIIIVLVLIGISSIIVMKHLRTNDIRKNAKSTIDCIINSDYSKDFYYISMYGQVKNELNMGEVANSVMSNMKYKLNNITIDTADDGTDFAIIKCEIKNVDMQDILYQFQNADYEYNEENLNLMLDKINSKNFKTKTFNIDIVMMKIGNDWYLYETPDFNDAITGGLYSLYTDMENSILNELTKENN